MMCLFPKASAGDPKTITPVGKMAIFKTWFRDMVSKCTYDEDFAINVIDKCVEECMGDRIANFKSVSCYMVDTYHKGVCRNFACRVALELGNWGIKNCIMKIPESKEREEHILNFYVSPIDGKYMVADLTLGINYKSDKDYDRIEGAFSSFPFEKYIRLFHKGIELHSIKFLDSSKPHIFENLDEFLDS